MTDPHQLISIMATSIRNTLKEIPDHGIAPEQAKQISKCLVEALKDAGYKIVPTDDGGPISEGKP